MAVDPNAPYDPDNIFARILRGEIPVEKVYEDEYALAFPDIAPQARIHVLIIPRGSYICATDFGERASEAEQAGLSRAIAHVAARLGVTGSGYRVISNTGADAGQEVAHYHLHLLAGEPLGTKLIRPNAK